eukprot:5757355-Amphidinium_carterae.1
MDPWDHHLRPSTKLEVWFLRGVSEGEEFKVELGRHVRFRGARLKSPLDRSSTAWRSAFWVALKSAEHGESSTLHGVVSIFGCCPTLYQGMYGLQRGNVGP